MTPDVCSVPAAISPAVPSSVPIRCRRSECPVAGAPDPIVHVVSEDAAAPMEGVGSAICKAAAKLDAAALVVTCTHKSPLAEWLLGSVSAFAARHSESPLIVLT